MSKISPPEKERLSPKRVILIFLFSVVIITIAASILQFMHNRAAFGIHTNTHDGAVQVEEAIKLLLNGKNPYTENYFDTTMEIMPGLAEMNLENPALYHLIYLPFNIIFSIPFYLASVLMGQTYDQRVVHLFMFLVFVAYILKWPARSLERKLIFLTIFAATPTFFIFFIQGRNDIFVFTLMAIAIYYLEQEKITLSSLALALAVSSKHSSWFILPFYFTYLYYKETKGLPFMQKIRNLFKKTYIFFAVTAAIIIPFLVWDPVSFIDDIVKYPNGTTFMSYPMTGFGFSVLLLKLNVISSPNIYWPFWIPQAIFGLPILYVLLKMQKNNNTVAQMVFNLAVILMAFWLFSRFFNDNYRGFLIMLFLFSLFLVRKPEKISVPAQKQI